MRWVYTFLAGDNIPFYAYNTISFTDGDQDGLGGYRTLRGFVDSRFMGKAMSIFNFEIRERMFVLSGAGQSFNFILVPFVDFGRVFDEVDRTNTKNWKVGYGAGLRLAWNQATIIMIDLGFSQESSALLEGLYINFNHIF
jgi:hemolysin activation/secretion protein